MQSRADAVGQTDSVGRDYGGGCATRRGMERAMETKRRWAVCTQRANPILSIPAIVASNPGDFGQGRVSVTSTGASRSDSIEKIALQHKLHATSASGIKYGKPKCGCQYPKVARSGPFFIR